jgi:hypothetical protein
MSKELDEYQPTFSHEKKKNKNLENDDNDELVQMP